MAKSSTFDNDFLSLIFKGTAIANLADNTATAPLTSLYIAGHSADPGAGGTQSTSEVVYTGYARVAVTRGAGWTVTGASVSPAAAITFPACTGGTATIAFWSVGVASTGATKILYSGAVSPTIAVSSGVTPQLTVSTAVTES